MSIEPPRKRHNCGDALYEFHPKGLLSEALSFVIPYFAELSELQLIASISKSTRYSLHMGLRRMGKKPEFWIKDLCGEYFPIHFVSFLSNERELDLSGKYFSPSSIFCWSGTDKNLSSVHFSSLYKVEKLNLKKTGLSFKKQLPFDFLSSLRELDISGLSNVFPLLRRTTQLTRLIASNVCIRGRNEIKILQRLGNLNELDLSLNGSLGEMAARIASIYTDLRVLNLSNVPTGPGIAHIQNLTKLVRLDLTWCSIKQRHTPYLIGLTQLTRLNLESNLICTEGFVPLTSLSGLEHLKVNCCELYSLPDLSTFTALRELDVSHNDMGYQGLERIASIVNLVSLKALRIGLEGDIPALALTRLELLELAWNDLSRIDGKKLGRLTTLTTLDVSCTHFPTEEATHLLSLTRLETFKGENGKNGHFVPLLKGFSWNDGKRIKSDEIELY